MGKKKAFKGEKFKSSGLPAAKLLVDVGNTSIHFGVVDRNKIHDFRILTKAVNSQSLKEIISEFPEREIVVCSVVPSVTALFKGIMKGAVIIGENRKVPITSLYNKIQIGQDRLLNAFAARKFYPKARLVIDFGTATTLDFISCRGKYLGGIISAGITLSYSSLSRCALLPEEIGRLSPHLPKIPGNTSDSIHKGVIEGSALMTCAWVDKYKNWINVKGELQEENVVVTGGQAVYVLKYLKFPFVYEPQLLFKGMLLL